MKDIRECTMLVKVTASCWTGAKVNREASDEVAVNKRAKIGRAKVTTKLVPDEFIRPIRSLDQAVRAVVDQYSVPWSKNGMNVFPVCNWDDMRDGVAPILDKHKAAVAEFKKAYPAIKRAAKNELGDLYNEADWPSESEIEGKFGIHVGFYPMPAAEDFRLDLPNQLVENIRDNLRAELEEVNDNFFAEAKQRAAEVVGDFVTRLKRHKVVPDDTAKRGYRVEATFRDTAVTNIAEQARILPSFNIHGDPVFTELTDALDELGSLDPDTLRFDDKARDEAVKSANSLLSKFGL
jgi:hypothetical protein